MWKTRDRLLRLLRGSSRPRSAIELCTCRIVLLAPTMPQVCENNGSAARDYAMLERNLLSHLRLAALILLLAASVLLDARLPSPSEPSGDTPRSAGSIPLASIEVAAALTAIGAGVWEYRTGYKNMQDMKGFLVAAKYVSYYIQPIPQT